MAVCKVPANDMEAIKSSLMGLFEKKRCMNFYKYIENVEVDKEETWKSVEIKKAPMRDVFKKYSLEE